jgi:hypothetical protein
MDEALAEEIMKFIFKIRSDGHSEESLISELMKEYHGSKEDFEYFMELMNVGAFRASILSSGMLYPEAYLGLEENNVLKTAFRLHWIALKGMDHYQENYVAKRNRRMQFLSDDF